MEEQQTTPVQPSLTPKKFPWKRSIPILAAFIIGFGGGTVLAWRTPYLDPYLPAGVKEFFGRGEERGEPTPEEIEEETKDWKTYKDEKNGYEIKYPAEWVYGSTKEGQVVFETSEENLGPGDLASKAIVVTAVALPSGSDVPDPLISDEMYGEKQKVERTAVTIGGLQGERVIFLDLDWVFSAVFREGTAPHPRRIYHFNLHKIEHREIYDLMISTFVFLPEEDPTKDWKTYKNEKYGYELKYPSSWVYGGSKGAPAENAAQVVFDANQEDLSNPAMEAHAIVITAAEMKISDPLLDCELYGEEQECERKSITIGGVQGEQVDFLESNLLQSAVAPGGIVSHTSWVYIFNLQSKKYKEIYDLMLPTFKFLIYD